MRSTSLDDDSFSDGLSETAAQPWSLIPELNVLGGPGVDREERLFLGQQLTRSRKTNTDRAGHVLSDVSRSISRCIYVRVAATGSLWSVETDDLAAAAVTVVTFRQPADADLGQGSVEVEWDLGAHWKLTRDLILTTSDGDRRNVVVDFLGPPGTRPGDDVTWTRSELYRLAL